MNKKEVQEEFIKNEIWVLAMGEGLKRSTTYTENVDETEKEDFKEDLNRFVNNLVNEYYYEDISEDQHIKNIKKLCNSISKEYADILKDDRLRIGVGQKILNLYLKYLWCLGEIPEPPNCPLDRTMIKRIESRPITSWTKMDDIDEYRELMEKAKEITTEKSLSLAEWELKEFGRD